MVRNNRAFYNVAGDESENSAGVRIYENDIYDHTSGLLILIYQNLLFTVKI